MFYQVLSIIQGKNKEITIVLKKSAGEIYRYKAHEVIWNKSLSHRLPLKEAIIIAYLQGQLDGRIEGIKLQA